jgi:hypothetical protein
MNNICLVILYFFPFLNKNIILYLLYNTKTSCFFIDTLLPVYLFESIIFYKYFVSLIICFLLIYFFIKIIYIMLFFVSLFFIFFFLIKILNVNYFINNISCCIFFYYFLYIFVIINQSNIFYYSLFKLK